MQQVRSPRIHDLNECIGSVKFGLQSVITTLGYPACSFLTIWILEGSFGVRHIDQERPDIVDSNDQEGREIAPENREPAIKSHLSFEHVTLYTVRRSTAFATATPLKTLED
ncbi:hypothetical protein NA57DRAFT_60518 [Rhizodiscina lignyota]|uniref:Uncharacterized protein n=1 Tax=Rhizodiscina lignyota TaxID=1504668 RepID=A0A9P4I7B1_9PEZI|nr:hypothetical protein NA57DRAFT_60518 [Rhizodiscina lignyota]